MTAAHFEPVKTDIYPADLGYYDTDFAAFYALDATAPACNTAFCCFTDNALLKAYLHTACNFMEHSHPGNNTLQYMVCAEQRILGMIAKAQGIVPAVLLDERSISTQRICTHTWGYKQTMRQNPDKAREYCARLERRLAKESPKWAQHLCPPLRQSADPYRG